MSALRKLTQNSKILRMMNFATTGFIITGRQLIYNGFSTDEHMLSYLCLDLRSQATLLRYIEHNL